VPDILCINVESEPELELLSRLAAESGRTARISVRVNPDVDSGSHAKISTGKSENKFGIPLATRREVYAAPRSCRASRSPAPTCISAARSPISAAGDRLQLLADFVQTLRADGHSISHVDFGGGLGIPYHGPRSAAGAAAYAAMVKRVRAQSRLHADVRAGTDDRRQCRHPGDPRDLCEARRGKNFVIIDAAMNDLIRPRCTSASRHPAGARPRRARDHHGRRGRPGLRKRRLPRARRHLPKPKPGDLLAIMTAGAYGAVQSGTYNTRALVPEVLVKDDQYAVVRPARRGR
jgi:diaminopimelate decarboxylase